MLPVSGNDLQPGGKPERDDFGKRPTELRPDLRTSIVNDAGPQPSLVPSRLAGPSPTPDTDIAIDSSIATQPLGFRRADRATTGQRSAKQCQAKF